MWDKVTYPFLKFNAATGVEVWEWLLHSRSIPMYNIRFILWPPSFSSRIRNMGRERRWPRWIKKRRSISVSTTVDYLSMLGLKFNSFSKSYPGNGYVISYNTLLGMWLLIHAEITINFCNQRAPGHLSLDKASIKRHFIATTITNLADVS